MTDRELVKRIKQGEKECFEELISRYYDDIYRLCCFKTGSLQLSYDLTQSTFLKLIKYIDAYEHREKFKSYLFSIAVNVCNDYFKENRTIPISDINLPQDTPEDFTGKIENSVRLEGLLKQLPEKQRDAVILRYYNDMKIKDIARVLGEKVPTIKSRIRQGIQKLSVLLSQEEEV